MKYSAEVLSDEKLLHLFSIEEDHFNDFKAKDISGKNFYQNFISNFRLSA